MTDRTPGTQGAARQNWHANNPRPLLRDIMSKAADPHDREVIREEFFDAVTNAMRDSMQDWWFDNHYAYFLRSFPKPGQTMEAHREEREAIKEQGRQDVAVRVRKIKKAIEHRAHALMLLKLDSMMPIGKAFGDCTGHELRAMRKHLPRVFDAVIKKVGDNETVRDVLTDVDLKKMKLRLA